MLEDKHKNFLFILHLLTRFCCSGHKGPFINKVIQVGGGDLGFCENLKYRFQLVLFSNGWSMCYILYTRLNIQIPEQFIRKQDGIHFSGIQMVRLSSFQMAFKWDHLVSNPFLTI